MIDRRKIEDIIADDVDNKSALPGFVSVYILGVEEDSNWAADKVEYFGHGVDGDGLAGRLFELSLSKKIVNFEKQMAEFRNKSEIEFYIIEVADCDGETNITPDLIEILQSVVGNWENEGET
jgi:hypothetical protein